MTIDEFRRLHTARPFVPFTLNLADDRAVYVDHPEFAMQTPGGRTVYVATNETVESIDLLSIVGATVGHNGRRRRGRNGG